MMERGVANKHVLAVIVFISYLNYADGWSCGPCKCDTIFLIDCSRRNLTSVPVLNKFVRRLSLFLLLEYNHITTLSEASFQGWDRLAYLDLGNNGITNINSSMFKGLVHLSSLRLQNNHITELNKGLWETLPKLKELDLRGNNISKMELQAFQGLNLERLYLGWNNISKLDAQLFKGLKRLIRLDLQ